MYSVEQLRKDGYKVRVTHLRFYNVNGKPELKAKFESPGKDFLMTKGGKTFVEITSPENENFVGEAYCSIKDGFNRKLGLQIALGRALRGN